MPRGGRILFARHQQAGSCRKNQSGRDKGHDHRCLGGCEAGKPHLFSLAFRQPNGAEEGGIELTMDERLSRFEAGEVGKGANRTLRLPNNYPLS